MPRAADRVAVADDPVSFGVWPAVEDRPMDEGHVITFLLGPDSPIIVGRSELRFLPDDPAIPAHVRRLTINDNVLLHGEVPLWRLASFVFTGMMPSYRAVCEVAARGPLPRGLRCRWVAQFMDTGAYAEDGEPFAGRYMTPGVRYEPVTSDAIRAAVLEVLAEREAR